MSKFLEIFAIEKNKLEQIGGIEKEQILSLEEYVEKIIEMPELSCLSHKRLENMIMSEGFKWVDNPDGNGKKIHYNFFDDKLFGIEDTIDKIVDYFKAGGQRLPTRKRILLLMGPPGGGKSTIVHEIKRGLEQYTKKNNGAVYKIVGCPQFDNPLTLIPNDMRKLFNEEHGIFVEGEPCPVCTWRLHNEFNGDWTKFNVERYYFSEQLRQGIGTFLPGDMKCVSLNSVILTDNGLMRLSEFSPLNPKKDSFTELKNLNIINLNGEKENVSHFYYNGVQPALRIKTEFGFNVDCTEIHPLRTINNEKEKWTKAKDLEVGQRILVRYNTNFYGNNTYLNENRAYLLGLFTAYGHISENNIKIIGDPNFSTKTMITVVDILNNEWGGFGKVTTTSDGLTIRCDEVSKWLKDNSEPQKNGVCYEIRTAPKNIQLAFLKGIFSENLYTTKTQLKFATKSKTFARDIHNMLCNMGYISALSSNTNPLREEYIHTISLTGQIVTDFITEMLYGIRPEERIDGIRDEITSILWNVSEKIRGKYSNFLNTSDFFMTRNELKDFIAEIKRNNVSEYVRSLINKIEYRIDSNYVWLKITDIQSIGDIEVADLTVPETHSFICNSIVSHNTQDISELVGSINLAKIGDYGNEADPRCYEFNGELNISNRGMVEFIEMLKADQKFLYVLLTLSQENNIKTPRFPLIYADEVIVAHTNETEWQKFIKKPENEALRDRVITILCPYNLELKHEVKINDKLLKESGRNDVHIAPHTLEVASMVAIMSRLEEPKDKSVTLLKKMKAYNGEEVEGLRKQEIEEMKAQCEREGMDGIGPRYISNCLSKAITKSREGLDKRVAEEDTSDLYAITKKELTGLKVPIDPIMILQSIREEVTNDPRITADARNRYEEIVQLAREEYDRLVSLDVHKAFVYGFEEEAKDMFKSYIDHAISYAQEEKVQNPITGDMEEPNEEFMRSIEKHAGIQEAGKDEFRSEILRRMAAYGHRNKQFTYDTHKALKESIEKEIFERRKDTIHMTTNSINPDPEQLEELNRVIKRMVTEMNYDPISANRALRYVSRINSRS